MTDKPLKPEEEVRARQTTMGALWEDTPTGIPDFGPKYYLVENKLTKQREIYFACSGERAKQIAKLDRMWESTTVVGEFDERPLEHPTKIDSTISKKPLDITPWTR